LREETAQERLGFSEDMKKFMHHGSFTILKRG